MPAYLLITLCLWEYTNEPPSLILFEYIINIIGLNVSDNDTWN